MRINTNVTSLNAHRHAKQAFQSVSKSSSKLSSGLRITKAADDAAGLTISEKMRAQIRGLNQASRNIQDGISMIQTAEAALESVSSLLQRGRELAVHAANETNTSSDQAKIQDEIEEIIKEVDKIAENTQFNTIKLLNSGAAQGKSLIQRISDGLRSGWIASGVKMIQDFYGLTPSTRTIDVIFDQGSVGDDLASIRTSYTDDGITKTIVGMELHIDLSDFTPSTGEDGENSGTSGTGTMYNDRIIAHEMVHAVMADQMGDDFFDMPTWFQEGAAEFIHGADDRVEADGLAASITKAKNLVDGTDPWGNDSISYSAGYLALKAIQENLSPGKTMKDIMSDIQDGDDTNDNTLGAIYANTTFTNITDFKNAIDAVTVNIDAGPGETDTGSIGGSDYGGSALDPRAVVPTGTYEENPTNFNFEGLSEYTPVESVESLILAVGANEGQQITIQLANVTSVGLGIESIDVTSDAKGAITILDNAIGFVSSFRSNFGSLQNRLESAFKSSQLYGESLSAAESRIRDVDMAKETMNHTKASILSQAANSMIAQANQQNQSVIQLLRA